MKLLVTIAAVIIVIALTACDASLWDWACWGCA